MLDPKFIREHRDLVAENSARRGVAVDVDLIIRLDDEHRAAETELQAKQAQLNKASKTKPNEETIAEMRLLKGTIKDLQDKADDLKAKLHLESMKVPNLTHPDTPSGGEEDFRVLDVSGEPPKFGFTPQDHEQLLVGRGLLDFERGAKVAGGKFFFARGNLVRLSQALVAYGIDVVTRHGYELLETPDLARDSILQGIGFNPRGPETQTYSIEGSDLSLIGTAEITVGGYHADEILDLTAGPKKYVALSHCFRTEAGAYGRESKGLYRVHQFTKLEMFVYCDPQESSRLHQELLAIEREIMDGLELPYRVIDIAAGDLGGPAYRKFDIEAWMVMRDGYGEVTSTSNCTDYQSRRLNIRYRTPEGQNELVHTLNGTAVVTSRLPIAIVENYQQADGSVAVPEALRPYLGGRATI